MFLSVNTVVTVYIYIYIYIYKYISITTLFMLGKSLDRRHNQPILVSCSKNRLKVHRLFKVRWSNK
jgi:ABC-type protease/lipase transport system fused ATPase/permease subunit